MGSGKISPVEAKIHCISQLSAPTTRKELQRFLGLVGYYRRFCPNFSEVVAPLTDMISPKKPFEWTDACQRAFESVKRLLTAEPVLKAPDFQQPFSIQVDASDVGIGAVLLQSDEDGVSHPVCYMSSKLKPYQRSYATVEKEAYALLAALEHFEVYLNQPGKPIEVYCDHNPLTFVNRMKSKNQRLTRWCLALQQYNLNLHHIRGTDNIVADFLSRSCADS